MCLCFPGGGLEWRCGDTGWLLKRFIVHHWEGRVWEEEGHVGKRGGGGGSALDTEKCFVLGGKGGRAGSRSHCLVE